MSARPVRRRAQRPPGSVESLGALIPAVLQQAATHHGVLFAVEERWKRLVGKRLASHTRPVSFRRGRLTVHVDHPADAFAFNYDRPRILDAIRGITDGKVDEIVVRAGDVVPH